MADPEVSWSHPPADSEELEAMPEDELPVWVEPRQLSLFEEDER